MEIFKDSDAYLTLILLDLFEISDSNAWAIASNPEEAFTLIGAEIKNSGTKKNLSGISSALSNECFIPSTYITALEVTSAPEPAVVGITANFEYLF